MTGLEEMEFKTGEIGKYGLVIDDTEDFATVCS